jgi:hypothetical protein
MNTDTIQLQAGRQHMPSCDDSPVSAVARPEQRAGAAQAAVSMPQGECCVYHTSKSLASTASDMLIIAMPCA